MEKTLWTESEYFDARILGPVNRFYGLQPDNWPAGGYKITRDSFDTDYFGRGTLRVYTENPPIESLAIKVYIYSNKITYVNHFPRVRVIIEFLHDGEESIMHKGYLYLYHR